MTRRWIASIAALLMPLGLMAVAPTVATAREVTPEVVNGEPGVAGDFPFLAYVFVYVTEDSGYECGGTFVSTTQVVTAAHCFFDEDNMPLTKAAVSPVVGTGKYSSGYGSIVYSKSIEVHEGYAPGGTDTNDIAIITLAQAIPGVSVATVPTGAQWTALTQAGATVRSAGWGTTSSGGEGTEQFRVADLRIVPDDVCESGWKTYTVGSLTYFGLGDPFDAQTMLCAGGATSDGRAIDTCQGDSGGPLVAGSTLVGIVSWGRGCAGESDGTPIPLTPGAYTRLGAYLPWLAERGIGSAETVTAPGAPTGISAVVSGDGRFTLQWTAPADDGGAAITDYAIQQSTDGGAWENLGLTDSASPGVDVVDVVPGSSYRYRVAAVNRIGTGDFSQPSAPVTMPEVFLTTPGTVSGFSKGRFTKTGKTYRVTVRWSPPADDGGSPVTDYVVRVGRGSTWSSWAYVDTAATSLKGLKVRTRYTLEVRAVNDQGPGEISSYRFTTPRR